MTKKKLNLIILIQSYYYFLASETIFYQEHENCENYLNLLWEYFTSIDEDILKEIGYSHNVKSLNEILNFKVFTITDELMNSELE